MSLLNRPHLSHRSSSASSWFCYFCWLLLYLVARRYVHLAHTPPSRQKKSHRKAAWAMWTHSSHHHRLLGGVNRSIRNVMSLPDYYWAECVHKTKTFSIRFDVLLLYLEQRNVHIWNTTKMDMRAMFHVWEISERIANVSQRLRQSMRLANLNADL